jgi:hypothetical protein
MTEDQCANRKDGFTHPNPMAVFCSEMIGAGFIAR